MTIKFTESEIKALEGHAAALRILAAWHERQENGFYPIVEFMSYHAERRKELEVEAARIDKERSEGWTLPMSS